MTNERHTFWRAFKCWIGLHAWGQWNTERFQYSIPILKQSGTELRQIRKCAVCGFEETRSL